MLISVRGALGEVALLDLSSDCTHAYDPRDFRELLEAHG